MDDARLKKALTIDYAALDDACVEIPGLIYEYGIKLARAIQAAKQAKLTYTTKRADYAKSIRNGSAPDKTTDVPQKLTEASLAECLDSSLVLIHLSGALNIAEMEVDECKAIIDALRTQRQQLATLAELYKTGYWTTSAKAERDTATAKEAVNERTRRLVRESSLPAKEPSLEDAL